MILGLNTKRDGFATGILIRKGSRQEFTYKTVKARTFSVNHPTAGLMRVTAGQSIQTRDELNFVNGDKVLLEQSGKTLSVINLSKDVKERQYMFVNNPDDITYTLDLG